MNFFDSSFLFFLSNSTVVVILLWLVTYLGSFFYEKKDRKSQSEFYECGFKSVNNSNFSLNVGTFIVMLFVVFYDVELSLVVPFLLNSSFMNFTEFTNCYLFYVFILLSFIVDIYEGVINWEF